MNQPSDSASSSPSATSSALASDTDIREQLKTLRDDVKELGRVTANAAGAGVTAVKDKALDDKGQVEDLARDNPMRAILVAAGVGAVLGLILGRR